ncbi:MAG: heptosyltransferase-1 [Candidatus Azotimanducaceae bacterium]|jgi:heptosyltransferase-1
MRVLLVKTSSLGDVVHALPAVTEASAANPELVFDWVVEEAFQDIPALHPAVGRVIPIAIRRWRKNIFHCWKEIGRFKDELRKTEYDLVIDSQGLLKSALVSLMARGPGVGFDRDSARESIASVTYGSAHRVPVDLHAVYRQKKLFGLALGYESTEGIHYGLTLPNRLESHVTDPAIVLLHGTTWESKEWPEVLWRSLADQVRETGFRVVVPAGNQVEFERAKRITNGRLDEILDRQPFASVIDVIRSCRGVVSVDTGLGHLATGLDIPVVGLYGSTSPELTGFLGPHTSVKVSNHLPCIPCRKRHCQYEKNAVSSNIYPPCYEQHSPETVWQALQLQIQDQHVQRPSVEKP